MNPNNETWQDKAREMKNPMISQERERQIKHDLQLVNITNLSNEDYQLLQSVYK